jgi:hypothetical protein
MDIEYDEIDDGIEELVRLFNEQEGIVTTFSCTGHEYKEWYSGYISFKVKNLECLHVLIRKLNDIQFFTWSFNTEEKRVQLDKGLTITVDEDSRGDLVFRLSLEFPDEELRNQYIKALEDCLKGEYNGERLLYENNMKGDKDE